MPVKIKDLKQNDIKYQDTSKPQPNKLLEFLKLNYPSTIKDGTPSINEIAEILGVSLQSANIGYELNFTGKPVANALYNTPTTKALCLKDDKSTAKNAANQIIIGDNIEALKILQSAYNEKIKLIYIDPPYNTGNDGFVYPDSFKDNYQQIFRDVGLIEIDEDGNESESDIVKSFKGLCQTKTHSPWLFFMLPRLKLARDLLRDDGVIFISIDDNEQANLKILCDEIFGEDNFVADIIWKKKNVVQNDAKFFSTDHEYILCYGKNIDKLKINLLPRTEEMNLRYSNPDNDPRGDWTSVALQAKSGSNIYEIEFPNGVKWKPTEGTYPRLSKEGLKRAYIENRLWFGKNGKNVPRLKKFLSEVKQGIVPNTIWFSDEVGSTQLAKENLKTILKANTFDTPKPVRLIKQILQLTTTPNSNDIILDFFAGSGTTAQAVIEQNRDDNGNRKFILIQLDEKIDDKKSKMAYDFCKNELKSSKPNISDITIERVKRVGGEFSVYGLEEKNKISNEQGKLSTLENQKPKDRAINMALFSGLELDVALDEIEKDELYFANNCYFLVSNNSKILAKIENNKKVFLDGFCDFRLSDVLNLKQNNEIEFIF